MPIPYMGTKSHLAPLVRHLVGDLKRGIFYDAFAGMCTVGQALADGRTVWASDSQLFAARVAEAVLTFERPPEMQYLSEISRLAELRYEKLASRYSEQLHLETAALQSSDATYMLRDLQRLDNLLSDARAHRIGRGNIFFQNYSNSYFSVKQALEIDALLQAANSASRAMLSYPNYSWLLLAAGVAAYRIASTTGHFAQHLTPSIANAQRVRRQRNRSFFHEFLRAGGEVSPAPRVHSGNRALHGDSLTHFASMRQWPVRPAVVYADPPYTEDQYSRYYHILDSIVRYEPHNVSGRGRYPPHRFSGPFSKMTLVEAAFDELAQSSAAIDADLVLSYPSNGILYEVGASPASVLRRYYRKVRRVARRTVMHSTFGASKGSSVERTYEHIYIAVASR